MEKTEKYLHGGVIRIQVNSNDKHRSIGRRSRDDNLFGSTINVSLGFVQSGEDTSGLDHVFGSNSSPRNVLGVTLTEDLDAVVIDNQQTIFLLHLTLEAAMGGVILEHVNHVVQGDERVVDSNNLTTALSVMKT